MLANPSGPNPSAIFKKKMYTFYIEKKSHPYLYTDANETLFLWTK